MSKTARGLTAEKLHANLERLDILAAEAMGWEWLYLNDPDEGVRAMHLVSPEQAERMLRYYPRQWSRVGDAPPPSRQHCGFYPSVLPSACVSLMRWFVENVPHASVRWGLFGGKPEIYAQAQYRDGEGEGVGGISVNWGDKSYEWLTTYAIVFCVMERALEIKLEAERQAVRPQGGSNATE